MTRGTYIAVAFIVVAGLMYLAGQVSARIRERAHLAELLAEVEESANNQGLTEGMRIQRQISRTYPRRLNQKAGIR